MATISENIKYLRESKKWTKTEMARILGLATYTTITKWESGENHPRACDLKVLCKLFGVTSDALLGISDMDSKECINYYKYYPVAVSAGLLESIDSISEDDVKWLPFEDGVLGKYAGSSEIFFVDVNGTSMNKVIAPNSRIGIKPINDVKSLKDGDIVLFSVENEFSIKRFYIDHTSKRMIFKPESTDQFHTDIVINLDDADKVVFYGKVILNISQYF